MIKQPPYLKKGDKIGISSPAKKLTADLSKATAILEGWGLQVVLGENVYAAHDQFAGTDEQRRKDLQTFLDDPRSKPSLLPEVVMAPLELLMSLILVASNQKDKMIHPNGSLVSVTLPSWLSILSTSQHPKHPWSNA
ncbi:LD-carboxypeptidase [Pedobacter sp. PACM 27299]|uniref:LD-carboxypeptidase n=1 Tax=Pedobacter sp. PACM 27299 TaxID=1727164 RepID=UPI000B27EAC4|nr:LD-carboxypeptidase [Pedobacter sp. PACM 27299]